MDEESRCNARQSNTTLVPSVHLDLGSIQDKLSKDDGVGARPSKEDDIACVEACSEVLGTSIDELQIVLFAAVLGDCGAELQIDRHAAHGNDHTRDPDEQTQANTAGQGEYRAGGCEDASSDHTVEDQEKGTENANLAFALSQNWIKR